jgi:hypothetical protein
MLSIKSSRTIYGTGESGDRNDTVYS